MENNENEKNSSVYTKVPAKVSPWTSLKNSVSELNLPRKMSWCLERFRR